MDSSRNILNSHEFQKYFFVKLMKICLGIFQLLDTNLFLFFLMYFLLGFLLIISQYMYTVIHLFLTPVVAYNYQPSGLIDS